MKDVKRKAYEKYQMHWMLSRGITVSDIGKLAEEWHGEWRDSAESITFPYIWEEHGFDGYIWACFEEFMGSEYQDRGYMQFLLTEDEWREYLVDVGDGYIPYIEAIELVEKCVKNRVLQETESHIFIERTTGWYLEPKDMVAKDLMYDKEGRDILTAALKKCEDNEVEDDI